MSKREDKRLVAEGVRALKQKAGWDPAKWAQSSGSDRLEEAQSEVRSAKAYESAEQCTDCESARADLEDETALCEHHLTAAMGLG